MTNKQSNSTTITLIITQKKVESLLNRLKESL